MSGAEKHGLDGLHAWDRVWRIEPPEDYVPGIYSWHQIEAFSLLRSGCGLPEWAANLLQVVAYTFGQLSPGQSYWLELLLQEYEDRGAV